MDKHLNEYAKKLEALLEPLDSEDCAKVIQWYIDIRVGLKGYCRT